MFLYLLVEGTCRLEQIEASLRRDQKQEESKYSVTLPLLLLVYQYSKSYLILSTSWKKELCLRFSSINNQQALNLTANELSSQNARLVDKC